MTFRVRHQRQAGATRAFIAHTKPDVLAYHRRRIDDFLGILETRMRDAAWVFGDGPTIVDLSTRAALSVPPHESGSDVADRHPAIRA